MKPLEAKARENLAEIQRLKQELRTKKKICNAYEHALNNPIFKCSLCRKCFKTQGFLDEHIKRRHVNAFGGAPQDKSNTLPSKIVLRETATSPMIPKSENMNKVVTSQFDYGDKENLKSQVNQMKGQSMKEEKGVLTEGLYPSTNIVYAASTSTQQQEDQNFEKMQNILKKFKEEDDQKISSLNQSINEKIGQIMNVNNETARKVNELEHKVEAYTLTASRFSRSQLMDLTHEEHHDEPHHETRNLTIEVPSSQRTNEEIPKKSPMKVQEGAPRYREQADYNGSGDVLEPREEHEEEEEVIEKENEGDLKIVELEEVEEDKPERDVQDIPEEEEEQHERPEYKEINAEEETRENEGNFTQNKRDRIAAYNRLYHIDELEEEPVAETAREYEEVEEKAEKKEEVKRQGFNSGDMEDDFSEVYQSRSQKNEKIKIEDQGEEEIDENKSIPMRKKTTNYAMGASSYRERPLEHQSIEEVEEEHHEDEHDQNQELPYEDEDERERTMRIIESSMGLRGDEDKQVERDRKEYLKARETMDQKYLAEMMQPNDVNKAQESLKGDMKNSFKNMFGTDYDLLAGKDMNDLESILNSLQTLNLKQKQRFDKMKTDYSRINRKDVFADEDHQLVRKVQNNEGLLPNDLHDHNDAERSIQETSMRVQQAKASLAELEQVLKESRE